MAITFLFHPYAPLDLNELTQEVTMAIIYSCNSLTSNNLSTAGFTSAGNLTISKAPTNLNQTAVGCNFTNEYGKGFKREY